MACRGISRQSLCPGTGNRGVHFHGKTRSGSRGRWSLWPAAPFKDQVGVSNCDGAFRCIQEATAQGSRFACRLVSTITSVLGRTGFTSWPGNYSPMGQGRATHGRGMLRRRKTEFTVTVWHRPQFRCPNADFGSDPFMRAAAPSPRSEPPFGKGSRLRQNSFPSPARPPAG